MTGDQMNRPSRSRHTDDQSVVEQLLRQELSNFNETVSHFGWELIRNYSVIKENLKLIVHHFLWMSGYWKISSKYLDSNYEDLVSYEMVLWHSIVYARETFCDQIVIISLPCHSVTVYSDNKVNKNIWFSLDSLEMKLDSNIWYLALPCTLFTHFLAKNS